jgi:hypothetical protein
MKYRVIFVVGRAGCGKSALYRELEQRLLESHQAKTFERVDDFPKVWAKLQGDDALEREGKERIHSRRTADGGYVVTDDNFLDDVLKEVNLDVLQIDKPDHLIVLEFARPSYVQAFQNFDESILESCLVIYMQVDFEICWARNVARHEAAIAEGGDDHLVCRETMEALYRYDDRDAFVQHMKDRDIPVLVVNNEADGEEHLKQQVEQVWQSLFS